MALQIIPLFQWVAPCVVTTPPPPTQSSRTGVRGRQASPSFRRMMQLWADYLDGLKQGAKVIPIKRDAG